MTIVDIDINQFQFNESAEFYSVGISFNEIKTIVTDLWNEIKIDCETISELISHDKTGEHGSEYIFFAIKKNPSKPTFCREGNKVFMEQKAGYFLLVKNENKLAIFKQNINIPKKLKDNLQNIDYDDFVKLNINQDTEYKYINMKNIDGADYAIRSKTFEGNDLKKNISAVTSSKYFIKTLRGKTNKSSFSLNFGTSRLNHYTSKLYIHEVINWAEDKFCKFNSLPSIQNNFLSNFATKQVIPLASLQPTCLLVDLSIINNALDFDDDLDIFVNGESSEKTKLQQFLEKYSVVINLNEQGTVPEMDFSINITGERFLLENKIWQNIVFKNSKNTSLNDCLENIINKNNAFSVYFQNDSSVYSNGFLWKDSKLLGSIDWLIQYIEEKKFMENTSCEKTAGRLDSANLVDWDSDSEFKYVEDYLGKNFPCLICDDYDDEWADFIGIDKDQIEFFACKHKPKGKKKGSSSASAFHEVIGQALKNLGNFTPTAEQLTDKKTIWQNKYLKSKTKERTRGNLTKGLSYWENNISNPHYQKTSSVVVNFLSKRKLISDFNKLKADKTFANKEAAQQQLWLLSHFVTSCKEMGITPKIYCCP